MWCQFPEQWIYRGRISDIDNINVTFIQATIQTESVICTLFSPIADYIQLRSFSHAFTCQLSSISTAIQTINFNNDNYAVVLSNQAYEIYGKLFECNKTLSNLRSSILNTWQNENCQIYSGKNWLLFENGRKFISAHFDGIWRPTINQNRYRNLRIARACK